METDHPRAVESREIFHATWDEGEPLRGLEALSPDVVWRNDIGAGPIRSVRGRDRVAAMRLWLIDFFDGTFQHELVDACASDDKVLQVRQETGTKDGREFANLSMYVFEVDPTDPRRYAKVETFARDRALVEAFWSHFPDVLAADPEDLLAPFLP